MCPNSKSDLSKQAREFHRVDGDAVCAPMIIFQKRR